MPSIITITGSSASGKSTTIKYFSSFSDKSFQPVIIPKYTTRTGRKDDGSEIICTDTLPRICDIIYEQYNVRYGCSLEMIYDNLIKNKSPMIILNDVRAIEDIRKFFGSLVKSIFIFRKKPDFKSYERTCKKRGVNDDNIIHTRYQKAHSIYRIYIENIYLFDHILINSGTYADLELQIKEIVKGLERNLFWPLKGEDL